MPTPLTDPRGPARTSASTLPPAAPSVPKDLMRGIVGQAFGVPSDAIDLTYPSTSEQER